MLRGILISPDQGLRRGVEARIADSGHILLVRTFDRYLTIDELQRLQRAHSTQLILLDIGSDEATVTLASQFTKMFPGTPIVALAHVGDPSVLMRLMHAGVREFLTPPFSKELYLDSIARLISAVRDAPTVSHSTDLLFAFLPAKAGSGCSTVAMNAAMAMSRVPDHRVLLADFDCRSGIARFLLKLTTAFSVLDALERSASLDDSIWGEIVCRSGSLDVLASGPLQRGSGPDGASINRLLEFARARYNSVCVDLPDTIDESSIEIMHEARRILMVVHPDLASVYLAREKLRFLRSVELEDRVSIVLNRWRRDACLSMADIESVVGLPVQHTISDDYDSLYRALLDGVAVDSSTEIGKEFAKLGRALSETRSDRNEVTPKKRMVEYFSLLPARYSLFPSQRS